MNLKIGKPLIVFDIETTGLTDPIRIVQLGTIKYLPGGKREEKVRFFNPQRPIEPEATALHGITDERAAKEKPFSTYAKSMAEYFAGCDLCGFNLWKYDYKILKEEFARAGVAPDFSQSRLIDVMAIYHHFHPRNLVAAFKEYCGGVLGRAHEALTDAKATAEILFAQIERHKLPADVGGLKEFLDKATPRKEQRPFDDNLRVEGDQVLINFGKHRGKSLKWMAQNDRGYLEWMAGADFGEDIKAEIRKHL